MRTTLNLLTRNGAVYMDFRPALKAEQYAMLLDIAKQAETEDEMRNTVKSWAESERLTVSFEE